MQREFKIYGMTDLEACPQPPEARGLRAKPPAFLNLSMKITHFRHCLDLNFCLKIFS